MHGATGITRYQHVARNVISWTGPVVVKIWISIAFLFR